MAFWGGVLIPGGPRLRYKSEDGELHLALAVPLSPLYQQHNKQALQSKKQQPKQQHSQKGPSWVLMMQTRKGARAPIAKIGEFRQQLKILVTEDVEFWVETPGSPGGWSLQLAGTLVPHRRGGCSCCHDETANCTSREEHLHAKKRRIETDPDEAPALVDQEAYRKHKQQKQQQQQEAPLLQLSPETAKTPSLADQLLGYKASGPQQKPPPLSQQRQQEESEVVRAGDIYRLPSGVEYTVVRASGSTKGLRCSKGCNITIQYRGYLLKTKRGFDKGKLTFCAGTGEVIKGLELGLMGCREGETRKITIPSTLAYGKRGAPPSIPPNADLVFECTCTRIKHQSFAKALGLEVWRPIEIEGLGSRGLDSGKHIATSVFRDNAAAFLSLPLPKAWVREPSRLRAAGRVSLGLSIWSFGVSFILFVLAIVAAESLVDYVAAFLEVVCAAVIAYFGASAAFKRDWRSAGVYVAFALLMAAEQLLWVVFAVYHVKATKAQLTAVDRLSSAATEEEYLLLQEELTVAAAQLGLSIFSLASYCTSAAAAYGLRYQALVLGPGSHAAAAKSFADVAADALAAADAEDAAAVREGRRPTQRISVQHQLLQHQLNLLQQEQLEQQQLLLLRQEELMLQRIPRVRSTSTAGAPRGSRATLQQHEEAAVAAAAAVSLARMSLAITEQDPEAAVAAAAATAVAAARKSLADAFQKNEGAIAAATAAALQVHRATALGVPTAPRRSAGPRRSTAADAAAASTGAAASHSTGDGGPQRHQQIRRMHTDGAATGVHVEAGEAPDAW
ncbi:uncharacterized protein LOC34619162 [Cyclospora cayetanensis]|uniref:peptidylprolyl isomerase n=1 Tax=Cyclospora cayetanensis TaxID=88456 RepID=A0A6P6RYQ2_9EIME|nr:uncharacterized protein LOC34619162 [Cyclospora cayetanensis]